MLNERPSLESEKRNMPDTVLEIIKLENSLPEPERLDRGSEEEKEKLNLLNEREKKLTPEETEILENFRKKKFQYFSQEALRYKDLMRIFKEEGKILGKENKEWRAVTRHSLVASLVASELAKSLNERTGGGIDENAVKVAALLHDLTKHFEYSQEAKDFEKSGEGDRYGFSKIKMDEIFKKESARKAIKKFAGDPDKIKIIAQAAGIQTKEKPLSSLEEKIIFYVDKLIKHSAFVSLPERKRDVQKRYTHRRIAEEFDYAEEVEREISEIIGISPGEIPDFLQLRMTAKIEKEELKQ